MSISRNISSQPFNFPYQKRKTSQKGLRFCQDCLDAGLNMISEFTEELNSDIIQENIDTVNGKLDVGKMEKIVNPYGISIDKDRPSVQSFPLLRDKINLLLGEEWKRKFDYSVKVVNASAIQEKNTKKSEMIYDFLANMIIADVALSEEEKQKKLTNFTKRIKYNYRDLREIRANHILEKEWRDQDLKSKFNEGMFNRLVKRGDLYSVDVVAGRPEVRIVDPKTISVVRTGGSMRLEDADIIIEDTYESPGWIIDHYYDHLSDKEVKMIDRGEVDYQRGSGTSDILKYSSNTYDYPVLGWNDNQTELINTDAIGGNAGGYKDEFGNIRHTRMVWKSLRKLGIISWIDEDGHNQEKVVDENYNPNEELGETVEWYWVNEYWEVVRIGANIFPKYGPRPIQFRRRDNISIAGSGFVGDIEEVCVVDIMKPFQVMYDVFMERTKHAFMTNKGKIAIMDISKKPQGWTVKKWLHYMVTMGISFENSFNEGQKGMAKGKIAGNMQPGSKYIDLEQGNYINQHVMMLQYIEQRIGDIAGIPKAREGQSSANETATAVQSSVTQSYHITEPHFAKHDKVKERVLETLLETAKYCLQINPKLYDYYISDEEAMLSNLELEQFTAADYGLDVTTTAEDTQLINTYKQLAHAAIQNDKMTLSTLGKIYGSSSMAQITREIENSEQEAMERMGQIEQARLKAEQEKTLSEMQEKDKDRQLEKYKQDQDDKTKLMVKLLDIEESKMQNDNQDRISLDDIVLQAEKLRAELSEKKRMNDAELELKKDKQKEELQLKKEKQQYELKNKKTGR